MAKKTKEEKIESAKEEKKEEKKKEDATEPIKEVVKDENFNIDEMYGTVHPFMRPGLKKYISDNNIEINNEDDFKRIHERYGGL